MPKSQKVSKKAVERPPFSFTFAASFGLLRFSFQYLRSKPALGLTKSGFVDSLRAAVFTAALCVFAVFKNLMLRELLLRR
jgi:succinate-acetate transporter protein